MSGSSFVTSMLSSDALPGSRLRHEKCIVIVLFFMEEDVLNVIIK